MTETLPTTVDSEPTDDQEASAQETGALATGTQELALPYYAIRGRLRIRAHATRLFNDGLAAARNGRPDLARDFFAAFVFWYPHDADARSALALACLESGDLDTAREHWKQVLDHHPDDQKALRGLHALSTLTQQATPLTERYDQAPTTGAEQEMAACLSRSRRDSPAECEVTRGEG